MNTPSTIATTQAIRNMHFYGMIYILGDAPAGPTYAEILRRAGAQFDAWLQEHDREIWAQAVETLLPAPETAKRCKRCEKVKALSEFRPRTGQPEKTVARCRACEAEVSLDHYYKTKKAAAA